MARSRVPSGATRRALALDTLRCRRGGAFSGGPARTDQVAGWRAPSPLWRRSCAVSSSPDVVDCLFVALLDSLALPFAECMRVCICVNARVSG